MNDKKLSFCVPLEDMRGADKLQLLFNAFAASDVATRGLKLKRIGCDGRIRSNQRDVDGAELQVHASVGTKIFAGAAHGSESPGLASAHANLEDSAAGCIVGIQDILGFGEKRCPE